MRRPLLPLSRNLDEALRRLIPVVLLLIAATGTMWWGFQLGRRGQPAPAGRLLVTVVEVGHGEASWVRTPGGRFVLIGAGPPEAAATVAASLRAGGARRIDTLVVPYPYREAIGGAAEILRRFPVNRVLEPGYPAPPQAINEFQAEIRAILPAGSIRIVKAGDTLPLGEGVRLEILAPDRPFVSSPRASADNSLVLRLVWGRTAFLWAGGVERAGENALLARAADLRADWLRIARFGTREATSAEFLRRVQPSLAAVSVGPNSEGYPHAETLARLEASGALILRTDKPGGGSGTLRFVSDGGQVWAQSAADAAAL